MSTLVGTAVFVVVIAVVWRAWRALLLRAGVDVASVAAAATMGTFAVSDLCGRPFGSVAAGAAFAAGTIALCATVARRFAIAAPPPPTRIRPWTRPQTVSAALVVVTVGWCALGTFMWDERSTHLPLAGALARGVLPLQHPLFPGQPLAYHAGYAVVVALVRVATSLPLDVCADIVTLTGLVVLVLVLRDVLAVLVDDDRAVAVGIGVVLCAGGPVAGLLADAWGAPHPGRLVFPAAWVSGATFPPLVVTNLLQHPQGWALPLALAQLVVLAGRPSRGAVVVAGVFVLLLARVQVVWAAFAGLALVVAVAAKHARRPRGAVVDVVLVAAVGVAALSLTGFGGAADALKPVVGGAFSADGALWPAHALLAFGASLGAPAYAWWLWRFRDAHGHRERGLVVVLGVLGTLGFVVGFSAVYVRSWDIVKFFGVSMVYAHLALVAVLSRLPRRVAAAIVVVTCWSGVFWALRHSVLQGIVAPAYRDHAPSALALQLNDDCGDAIPANARVFSTDLRLGEAGWLVPGTHWKASRDTAALLLDRQTVERDAAAWAQAKRAPSSSTLAALDVSFAVVAAENAPVIEGATVVCTSRVGRVYTLETTDRVVEPTRAP
jgi:hypothetical protein